MSHIERALYGSIGDEQINEFLTKEGFKPNRNPFGYGECMRYVASKNFTVWFCVHDNFIYLNCEYECGGTIAETKYDFHDYDSFLTVYYQAVEWTKSMIE
jgi:hypothetical protein